MVTGNVGTLELRSSLFEGATLPVTDIVNTVRLEDVLADSFELKAGKEEAQAPAVPSGATHRGKLRPQRSSQHRLASVVASATVPPAFWPSL